MIERQSKNSFERRTSNILKDERPTSNILKDERPTSNIEHRTSNDEIGEFMLRDRSAPPVYKLAEFLIQNSTLDVRCSSCYPVRLFFKRLNCYNVSFILQFN